MLETKNISCFRGAREFFFDLSFLANPGDAWVITGQNGAGKSTLLSALAGLFPLTGGEVLWHAQPILSQIHDFHAALLLLGHKLALKGKETPTEHLERWASYRKCSPEPISQILETWDIDTPHQQIRTLSAGQQKRVALSRLLLEPKKLWLLDEPTAQLDTRGKDILAQLVKQHRQAGGAVVACTHEPLGWPQYGTLDMDAHASQKVAA